MRIFLTPQATLSLDSPIVSLLDVRPVMNGQPVENWQAEIQRQTDKELVIEYRLNGSNQGLFGIRAELDELSRRCTLNYWLENAPEQLSLDSFGIQFSAVENLRLYLRNGYFSWDGSYYVDPEGLEDFEPYEERPETGYAMAQLLPRNGEGSVIVGFDRHDRFQQTFTFHTREQPPALTVLTHWDQRDRGDANRCEGERLLIFEDPGTNAEGALQEWARLVAAAAPIQPRTEHPPITGWCSWYNLYGYINEENILEHLNAAAEVARRENLPMRVFQIDDGFTPEMGDWLEVKPQFPRGMKPLLDDIRKAGFVPGLWIAPFMVGNRSHLYRDHPDWVVMDRQSGGPLVHWKLYGEFRWHKRSEEYYILDTTHPEAFDYLRRVFSTWRNEWGCEYFKTDFMHFGSEHGPQRAKWHNPGSTRIEIWRRVAEMIREEIGEGRAASAATWLGCGCPLWASIGLVDGIRIGSDVGVDWVGHLSAHSLMRDLPTRNFANQILWQIDPDCILLRNRFHHLNDAEVQSLAIFAGMSGGVMMTSDSLDQLSPDRIRLWRLILPAQRRTCRYPFLGQTRLLYDRYAASSSTHKAHHQPRPEDPIIVQVRTAAPLESESAGGTGLGETPLSAIFFFNTGEKPVQRSYTLESLGLQGPLYIFDWTAGVAWQDPVERISLTLPAHDGSLLFAHLEPILVAPERLP